MLDKALQRNEAAAIVSMSGSNSGLTGDPEKLRDAVAKLHVKNLYRSVGHDCPDFGYFEADRIQDPESGGAGQRADQRAGCARAVHHGSGCER